MKVRPEARWTGLGLARWAALPAVLAVVLCINMLAPLRDDVAWLLYVAGAWLDGQAPYTTLIEVNPPTIIWLSAVPVLLARVLDVNVVLVAPVFFTACILGCAWFCAAILERRGTFNDPRAVFTVVSTVLLVLPVFEFYQREHLIAAAALPFLALRTGAPRPARRDSVLAGVLVGLCCTMKPHYALAFAAVETVVVLRGKRPAFLAIGSALAAGLLCLAGTVLFAPDYFRVVVPLALDLYLPSMHGDLVNRTTLPVLAAWGASLLLLLTHRRRLDDGGTTVVLVTFATGALLVYGVQNKGWFYQVLPAGVAAVLALVSWLATVRPGRGWRRLAMPAAVLALLFVGGKALLQLRHAAELAISRDNTLEARLAAAIRDAGANSYLAFATKLSRGFPVVQMAGVDWTSRFPSTWALEAEQRRRATGTLRSGGELAIAAATAREFLLHCPELVAVEDGGPVDAVALLGEADPAFAQVWARYRPVARIQGLQLYRPEARAATCDRGPPHR